MANSNLQEALLRAATGRNPSVSDAAIAGQTVQQLLGQGNGSYGYDSYLGDLESQYQQMEAAIEAQRAAQLSRIQAQYDAAVEKLERQRPAIEQNYEDTAKQAYTQNMLAKRDLPQQLAAQGLTGGLSESSQLALEAEYGNQLSGARRDYNQNLYDLDTQIGSVRAAGADALAGAEGDYNAMLSDARNNYLTNLASTKHQAQLAALENQRYQEQLAYQKEQDAIANALNREQFDWNKQYQQMQSDRDYEISRAQLASKNGSSGYDSGSYGGGSGSSFTLNDGTGGNDEGTKKTVKKPGSSRQKYTYMNQ